MNLLKKYSLLFIITGSIIILESFIIKTSFENLDLGKRFQTSPFYESDFYLFFGLFWLFLGIIYYSFYKIDKIILVDNLISKHYWFSLFFIITLISMPFLNKYLPTNEIRNTIIYNVLNIYMLVSFFLFIASWIVFFKNIIKSTYAYYVIKNNWNN